MQHTFSTREQAEANGYRSIRGRKAIEGYRVIDVSGPGNFGYDYALVSPEWTTYPDAPGTMQEQAIAAAVAHSVTVSLEHERNAGGSLGGYAPMFPPPLPGDCEQCFYDGERIQRMGGAATPERWDMVAPFADGVELISDRLKGWDRFTHLYRTITAEHEAFYLVRLDDPDAIVAGE